MRNCGKNTRPVKGNVLISDTEMELDPRDADELIGSFVFNEPYIDPSQEERFIARLSDEQETAYQDLKATRGSSPPRLSLDIIQHYVLWRVFDLGWTTERFGNLDRNIFGSSIRAPGYRASRKPERVGKKYQWIAYHEILGYISDHYQYRVMYEDAVPKDAYRGTWQLSVRDIDPSVVDTGEIPDRGYIEDPGHWLSHEVEIAPFDVVSNEQWLSDDSDVPGYEQHLRFTDPRDGSTWIKLHGSDTWRTPTVPGFDQFEVDRREIWLMACGYLIDAAEVEAFLSWSRGVKFSARWLPEPPRFHSLFFGEFGWSFASNAEFAEYLETQHPAPWNTPNSPVGLRPLALEYHAEASGYDCSLVESYRFYRPIHDFVVALDLRWTGHGAEFVDPDGVLVAFDPSAYDDCSSALLVREERLEHFLNTTGSTLVWAVSGEKSAVAPRELRHPQADFLGLSGACVYEAGQLKGHLTTHPDTADDEA